MKNGFFFDIDGTLYSNHFHELSDNLFDSLQQLKDQGCFLCTITSRSEKEASHLPRALKEFPFDARVYDGGAIVKNTDGSVRASHPLHQKEMQTIHDFCQEHDLMYRFSCPRGTFYSQTADTATRWHWNNLYLFVPTVSTWQPEEEVWNVLVWTSDMDLQKQLMDRLPDASFVSYSKLLEVRTPGISKEDTAFRLAKEENLDKVYFCGDGLNDVELLKMADMGICPASGHEKAKEAADAIAPALDKGGIPAWLKQEGFVR